MDPVITAKTTADLTESRALSTLDGLLARNDLTRDADIEVWALAHVDGELVGCMGLAKDVVKCSTVEETARGQNLLAPLLVELRYAALARGRSRLFVYTKPVYRSVFAGLGFRALAEVPDLVLLMEDDPRGIERYLETLAPTRGDAVRVGAVVINANPFTLGHEYLIRSAAGACDAVHVFVVGEDRSEFSYADRYAMVEAGIALMPERDRVVLHAGSRYVVSGSTFPQYFLKDSADITRAYTGIDLQLFRTYIAPALGIRHRFVGTEPVSAITAQYNADMAYWLQDAPSPAPAIELHEIARVGTDHEHFVSASRVRAYLAEGRLDELRPLVPASTYAYLMGDKPKHTEGEPAREHHP